MKNKSKEKKLYSPKYHHFTEKELWTINEHLPSYFQDEGLTSSSGKVVCPFCGESNRAVIQESIKKPYSFVCFKCNPTEPMSLINLHRKRAGIGFYQAATELAQRYLSGFSNDIVLFSQGSKPTAAPKIKKEEVKDIAGTSPFDIQFTVNRAKTFLDELFLKETTYRGLTKEILSKYGIGFLPDWISPYTVKGIDRKKHPSKRIIIPLTLDSNLVGYEARLKGNPAKYIDKDGKEKETLKAIPVYSKEATNSTFPLFNEKALDEDYCVIVEGWLDAIMLNEYGTPACATLGITKLAGLIHRLQTAKARYIFIAFDNDDLAYNNLGELLDKGQGYSVAAKRKLNKALISSITKEEEELDALCCELAKVGGYANFPKDKYKRLLELSNATKEEPARHIFLLPTIAFTLGEKDFNDMYLNAGKPNHLVYKSWTTYIEPMAGFVKRFVKAYKEGAGDLKEQLEQAFYIGWKGDSTGDEKSHRLDEALKRVDLINRIMSNTTVDERTYYNEETDLEGEKHIIRGRVNPEALNHRQRLNVHEVRLSFVESTAEFLKSRKNE